MCVCSASGMVDIEAETTLRTCTYMDESCIYGYHVSKDFCTPVINDVSAVAVKKGSLVVGPCPQKLQL